MSELYFGGVWPPGIEGFNILLNIPVSMKNKNTKNIFSFSLYIVA